MSKFTKGHAANLYFESVLWLVCPHADKIPSSMLAMTVAACGSDFVSFEEWCRVCQITFLEEDTYEPSTAERADPLPERSMTPRSEMTEEQILNHNDFALKSLKGFPGMIEGTEEEFANATPEHVGANGGGV